MEPCVLAVSCVCNLCDLTVRQTAIQLTHGTQDLSYNGSTHILALMEVFIDGIYKAFLVDLAKCVCFTVHKC